jgi:hypothetical protein
MAVEICGSADSLHPPIPTFVSMPLSAMSESLCQHMSYCNADELSMDRKVYSPVPSLEDYSNASKSTKIRPDAGK